MELSITPAGDLRLCKARGISINKVKHFNEPGMQVDQWGEAGSAADGVCSNVTLDTASCRSNCLCMFLPLGGRPAACQKIRKMFTTSTQIEVLHALDRINAVMRQRDYALRFLALFSCFIHRVSRSIIICCLPLQNIASSFLFNGGPDRI